MFVTNAIVRWVRWCCGVGVLIASVREGRKGAAVADWVMKQAEGRPADYVLVDLQEHPLSHFAEPFPPMMGRYSDPATLQWASLIAGFDAFVFVTAEYNHGLPSSLKNALDHVYAEWGGKVAGLVGYGVAGGARALDQLRVLCGVLNMADVGPQVELSVFEDITADGVVENERTRQSLTRVFDAVEAWDRRAGPIARPGDSMTISTRRPAPMSRRQRPAKPPLSREWIIAETIEIMRREGLQAATMRRVAEALDTGPASLYVYVANTIELRAAVVDELMGQLAVRPDGDWASKLRQLLQDYRDLLFAHPGLANSAIALRPSGPNTIAFIDTALSLLIEGGVDSARAAWTVDLLLLYATALSAEHTGAPPNSPPDRATTPDTTPDDSVSPDARWHALVDAIRDADAIAAPHVVQHAEALLGGTSAQRWAWALDVLIGGGSSIPTPIDDAPDASSQQAGPPRTRAGAVSRRRKDHA